MFLLILFKSISLRHWSNATLFSPVLCNCINIVHMWCENFDDNKNINMNKLSNWYCIFDPCWQAPWTTKSSNMVRACYIFFTELWAIHLTSNINQLHYGDVIMRSIASKITGVSIVCLTVCSGADQRKHRSYASLAFVMGIHRSPVDSPHKGLVTRKKISLDDVIMQLHRVNNSTFIMFVVTLQRQFKLLIDILFTKSTCEP